MGHDIVTSSCVLFSARHTRCSYHSAMTVLITAEILVKALQHLPRGSSAGASAWTYEHVKAACAGPGMFEAILQFMNNIVAGNLPDVSDLRACRLLPLKEGNC